MVDLHVAGIRIHVQCISGTATGVSVGLLQCVHGAVANQPAAKQRKAGLAASSAAQLHMYM